VDPDGNMEAVWKVLREIGADTVPELVAFNKCDLAPDDAKRLVAKHEGSVAFSAVSGTGVDELLRTVADRLRALTQIVDLVVPYDRGDVLAAVHREGEVLGQESGDESMRLRVRFDEGSLGQFTEFVVA
jgi:GTP-binding protein HflX